MKHRSARKKGRIAYILLPVLLYLFLFSPIVKPELVFEPVWAVDVGRAEVAGSGDSSLSLAKEAEALIPFQFGGIFGYAFPDGRIKYRDRVLYGALLGGEGFINYSNVSDNLVLRNTDGTIRSSINTPGYPVSLGGDRVLVIDTSRTGLQEMDMTGTEMWRRDFPILITDTAENNGLLFVGRADGFADLLDAGGELVYQWSTEGTRVPIVYACAVSASGSYLAVIAGLDPQKLVLLQKKENDYKPVLTQTLRSDFRRSMNLRFSDDEKYLFYEDSGALRCYVMDTREEFELYAGTRSLRVDTDPAAGLLYHLYAVPGHRILQVVTSSGYVLTQLRIPEGGVMVVRPESLYLGSGSDLMRLDAAGN